MELSIQSGSRLHVHKQLQLMQMPIERGSGNRLGTDRHTVVCRLALMPSSPKPLPSAALSFPLAVSDYIRSSIKSSTATLVSSFIPPILLTPLIIKTTKLFAWKTTCHNTLIIWQSPPSHYACTSQNLAYYQLRWKPYSVHLHHQITFCLSHRHPLPQPWPLAFHQPPHTTKPGPSLVHAETPASLKL